MFVLQVQKNRVLVKQREAVTSGSVNVYTVRFELSGDWDGLLRTAVFWAGQEKRSVLLGEDNTAIIPWETLQSPGLKLYAGVYGEKGGEVVLPTVWADLGAIKEGATTGPGARPPTPDLWEQELERKGDALSYDGLKLSLMSGNNELSSVEIASGGESYIPVPGKDGVSPTVSTEPIDGGTKVTITDIDGEHPFTVYNGKDGYPGAPGADGVSPTVEVSGIYGGHRVTITDLRGPQSFDVMDGVNGSGEGGTTDHRLLSGRDAANQHPVSAIEGLREILDSIPQPMSADELREILMNGDGQNG